MVQKSEVWFSRMQRQRGTTTFSFSIKMEKTIQSHIVFRQTLRQRQYTSKSKSVVCTPQAERDNGKPAQISLQIRL